MDISKLSDIEYKYIFSVDNIESAIELNRQRCNEIKNIDCIEEENKQMLIKLSKDFEELALKLKVKQNIKNSDDFDCTHRALIICNAKLAYSLNQEELKNKEYSKFLKKHKCIAEKIDCFDKINFKLGNSNYLEVKLNNWFTIFSILFIIIVLSVSLTVSLINKSDSGKAISSILLMVFLVLLLFKKKKTDKLIKRDYIQRIIGKNEYISAKTQAKYDIHFLGTIKNTLEKKL
ncbi:MAG: hypothetical protein ACI4XP_04980 [Acutalibacteraceae bacterium]